MFGKKHSGRRSTNPIFILSRLILSLIIFAVLLGGIYSAYKHFSGLDPLKLAPFAVVSNLINSKSGQQVLGILSSIKIGEQNNNLLSQISSSEPQHTAKPIFKFLTLTDSHSDNNNLQKAINQAKQKYPDIQFIIGLGDYTEVGTLDELRLAKYELDLSTLRYFVIPGDHDLWDSRDKQQNSLSNFKQIFGPNYQSFIFGDYFFLLLDNSDNYLGIGPEQEQWLISELEKGQSLKGILVFIHEPLYHPSSDHFMGRVEPKLKQQAKSLIYQLKAAGAKLVLSGDIHYFSEYLEPETNLPMVTVGSVTSERNPQAPRYAIVWVFDNGSVKVEDVEIK